MPANHYVQNQGKLMIQSRENGQKPQSGQFFWRFRGQISPNCKFFWKIGFKLNVIFSTNFRPKTKNNSKSRIFSKIPLSLFYLYSPLTSCKKSEKSLEPFLRKLRYKPNNQPTNQPTNQPILTNNSDFIGPSWHRSKKHPRKPSHQG